MAKRKKKLSKASKRRLAFFAPLCILSFVYLAICTTSSFVKLYNLHQEKAELNDKLTQLQEDEEELKIEIDRLNDPDYLARYARENYLYSKDGEYVIKIEDQKKEEKNTNNKLVINEDIVIICLGILLFLIMIFIIKKRKKKN